MIERRHFVTGNFRSHAVFLPEKEYATVLDNVVIACVDCVVINRNGEMLLGKRIIEPWPDWWIVGGRMRPGESFEEAAARNLKRELNLAVDPARFKYLDTLSLVFARRAQPPQENGAHAISITMTLYISDEEKEMISPNEEYEKIQWLGPESIFIDSRFHPAIRRYAALLLKTRRG